MMLWTALHSADSDRTTDPDSLARTAVSDGDDSAVRTR